MFLVQSQVRIHAGFHEMGNIPFLKYKRPKSVHERICERGIMVMYNTSIGLYQFDLS